MITFWRQKNGDKGATVTQHRNDNPGQSDFCHVRNLADPTLTERGRLRMHRIGDSKNKCSHHHEGIKRAPTHIVQDNTRVTQDCYNARLQEATWTPGRPHWRSFSKEGSGDGKHLAGIPSETVQIIGRWQSRMFMRYICIHVPTLECYRRLVSLWLLLFAYSLETEECEFATKYSLSTVVFVDADGCSYITALVHLGVPCDLVVYFFWLPPQHFFCLGCCLGRCLGRGIVPMKIVISKCPYSLPLFPNMKF